ncbi:FKBP-type peptidyl-prolyl cis-trans isomerase [Nocardioides sp.]|uniref:FKBP-type peptidyl-prolyl cis-trans isomerase n=1 Tax=Nocardioides sp. TaxID=35761 RepID=UPI0039E27596
MFRPTSRSKRHLLGLLVASLALIPALAGCGEEKSTGLGDKTLPSWQAATVEGDPGAAPTVTWNAQMSEVEKTETKTLVEGSGATVEKGGKAWGYVWIGNGYTQTQSYSDYDSGSAEELTADASSLSPVFEELLTGAKIGSRVAAVTTGNDVFGAGGNPTLGVADTDPLLVIVDLVAEGVDTPTDVDASQLPAVIEKKGLVTGLDFTGLTEPEQYGPFLRATLKEGDGVEVTSDMTVTVNYLGAVFGKKKAFDESYSTGTPATFALSEVVAGWTYGLTGVKVGSRVVLQIPPLLGYGGQEQDKIPANSTLYFVVDVIDASVPASSDSADASEAPAQ